MDTNRFQKAFSLIELIFIIAVLAIISSVAIPKLMGINSKANISVIKQDINTIISSVQSYYLIHNKIDKISDATNLNSALWDISDTQLLYKTNAKVCVKIVLSATNIVLNIDQSAGDICTQLYSDGIVNTTYNFN
jgi:general secretion pathway protein G